MNYKKKGKMSDLQSRLKKIQQDKLKEEETLENEDIDEMINFVKNKPYKNPESYYRPNQLDQVIPDCYKNIITNEHKFANYVDETLFYIFYSNPGTEIQLTVYGYLNKRGYRYSKCLRMFIIVEENVTLDNLKHTITVFDPFNWCKINKDVVFDDKFVYSLEK